MSKSLLSSLTVFCLSVTLILGTGGVVFPEDAEARRVRNNTRTNVNRNRNVNVNRNSNRNVDINRNVNRNVNRNINVDVDVDYRRRHPVGAAVGVAAATALVVGTIVYSLPPSCQSVSFNGFTYQQCGNTWYQPQYAGDQITYVVINPPY